MTIEPKDVRLLALWQDDPTRAPMTVDLRIAEARLASHWDVFGAFDLDGAAQPFVLRRDGRIDFAAGRDPWRTTLREADLHVGATFLVWFNDQDSGLYKIGKIAMLGAKERI